MADDEKDGVVKQGSDEGPFQLVQNPAFQNGSPASLNSGPPILTAPMEDPLEEQEFHSHLDEDRNWAWVVFFFIFIGRVLVNGTIATFNIYFSLFLEVFKESRSVTGFIGSVMLAMYDGAGLLCALVVNKLGARLSIIVGGFAVTSSMVLSTWATDAVHLIFTFGVLVGLATNLVSMAFVVGLRNYFKKYLYLVQGVSTSGAGLGMFLLGSTLPGLIDGYGWSGTLIIHGAILLNLCVVGMVVFPVRKSKFVTTCIPPDDVSFRAASQQLFCTMQFWCESAAFFFYSFSYATVFVLYKDYAIMRGLKDHFSSGLFALGAGDIIGRLGSGFITSLTGVNPVAFCSGVHVTNSIFLFLLIAVDSPTGLLVVTSLYGTSSGCANGLSYVLPCHLYPTGTFLVAFSYLCLASGFGSLSGTPTAGFIIDQTKSYDQALAFTGVFALLAGAMHFAVYVMRCGRARRALKQGVPLKVIRVHKEEN